MSDIKDATVAYPEGSSKEIVAVVDAIERLIENRIAIATGNNQAWLRAHAETPGLRDALVVALARLTAETAKGEKDA